MYQERIKIDWLPVVLWAILVVFGWMNIYASTYNPDISMFDLHTNHGKQLLWMGIAAVMAAVLLLVDPRLLSNAAYPIYALIMLLLVATLFVATTHKGGNSWIEMKGMSFQPAEFGKFATVLALAKFMSGVDVEWKQWRTRIGALIIIAIPAALVLLQHDAGSALVFMSLVFPLYREGMSGKILLVGVAAIVLFVLALVMNKLILIGIIVLLALGWLFLWLSKRTLRTYIGTIAVVLCCVGFIYSVDFAFDNLLEDHQRERISDVLGMTEEGYNVRQSKIAVGSGGFWGKGYLKGTFTKADFVPEQHTDFIFCTVGEEWGWLGCTAVVALYVLLLVHLITMAERQRSTFARVFGYSVASILFMHFFVNIGMVIGLMPVIGIPLPFFSYGGSSLIAFTLMLFIFIRLDATKNQLY